MSKINVLDFSSEMLPEASLLAQDAWLEESASLGKEQREIVYQYLVRYFYHPGSFFNLAVKLDGKLAAFVLACPWNDHQTEGRGFLDAHRLDPSSELLKEYKAYLDASQHLEDAVATSGDLILTLFVSARRGCGKQLLAELSRRGLAAGYSDILLWTDDTCDKEYYATHGFDLVAQGVTAHPFAKSQQTTLVYRRSLTY